MAKIGEVYSEMRDQAGYTKAEAERALEVTMAAIAKVARNVGPVRIAGVGTFKLKTRKARVGLNPRTKEKINIPARDELTFKES